MIALNVLDPGTRGHHREHTFNFRLPTSLKQRLDHISDERGISKADIAVAAIREFLETLERLDRPSMFHRVYPTPVNIKNLRPTVEPEQTPKKRKKA
jgi:hypothetical protein